MYGYVGLLANKANSADAKSRAADYQCYPDQITRVAPSLISAIKT